MASMKQPMTVSSGSDEDPRYANVDERKRKRMISNRESARRSRMRKQQKVEGLINQAAKLRSDNKTTEEKINHAVNSYVGLASRNNVLRAQMAELTDRLNSLNSVIQIAQDVSCFPYEIPDDFMEPWQLPFPEQPVVGAPTSMFQC